MQSPNENFEHHYHHGAMLLSVGDEGQTGRCLPAHAITTGWSEALSSRFDRMKQMLTHNVLCFRFHLTYTYPARSAISVCM